MMTSANDATITPNFITDSAGGQWSITPSLSRGAQICHNGTIDPVTANVTLVFYHNGSIYQQNTAGNFYRFTNPGWVQCSDPRITTPTSTPAPTPTPAPTSAPTSTVTHYGTTPPLTAPAGWTVDFFEDFLSFNPNLPMLNSWTPIATTSQNPTKQWTLGRGNGAFSQSTGEQEYYCSPGLNGINPFSQAGSILTITASVPTSQQQALLHNFSFISGALSTYLFLNDVTSGFFECNMKLPAGKGMTTQFWVTGTHTWPPEFDIIEQFGGINNGYQCTSHFGSSNSVSGPGAHPGSGFSFPSGGLNQVYLPGGTDITTGFHTYGGLLTPNYLAWYFDGHLVGYTTAGFGSGANLFNSTNGMQVVINLALGTELSGGPFGSEGPVTSSELPAQLQIDWFRYSKLGPA